MATAARRLRVLVIHDHAHLAGGSEIMSTALRDRLRERGHRVRTFASDADGGADADVLTRGTTSRARGLLQSANPWAARDLRRELTAHPPDVVHLSTFLTQLSPLVLPVLRDVPLVARVEWYRVVCPTGFKTLPGGAACERRWGATCVSHRCLPAQDVPPLLAAMHLTRRWSSAIDAIHTCSHDVSRELRAAGWTHAIDVLHPGVPLMTSAARPGGPPLVAYAGRLAAGKGVEDLIDAFTMLSATHHGARMRILGDGPLRAALERRARGLDVEFLGHRPQAAVQAALRDATVQAVPSRAREAFGIAAAEALMRGTPVVVTASGGLPEIVDHERTGLIVPPGDPVALAGAMRRIADEPPLAARLAAAGHAEAVARFTLDGWLDGVERLLAITAAAPTGRA